MLPRHVFGDITTPGRERISDGLAASRRAGGPSCAQVLAQAQARACSNSAISNVVTDLFSAPAIRACPRKAVIPAALLAATASSSVWLLTGIARTLGLGGDEGVVVVGHAAPCTRLRYRRQRRAPWFVRFSKPAGSDMLLGGGCRWRGRAGKGGGGERF